MEAEKRKNEEKGMKKDGIPQGLNDSMGVVDHGEGVERGLPSKVDQQIFQQVLHPSPNQPVIKSDRSKAFFRGKVQTHLPLLKHVCPSERTSKGAGGTLKSDNEDPNNISRVTSD
ncbi:hypothetical protein CEXT_672711 [Caerostris extrusa]|uniref:Uncharacterized protein n=1 Tax=Caerostris extrusa TaxID=172846 RepID=A0AAV4QU29_CAEEX|nr:hypothetical protein CEXT_672711 [Caerostris extrusa]